MIDQNKTNIIDVESYVRKILYNATILEIIEQQYFSGKNFGNSNTVKIIDNIYGSSLVSSEIPFNRNVILSSIKPEVETNDHVFTKTISYKDRFLTLVLYNDDSTNRSTLSVSSGDFVIVSVI